MDSPNQQCRNRTRAANYIFKNRKVFNDPVIGHIYLHPVCARIIDTPQFQRLRNIKQLDACYLVYPGASHNRFEHSIGTCYLAGQLLRKISERQPDERITERDILCVEIAGLCHDLGQGPFSHVFEKRFMPRIGKVFTHEETARKMFEYMLEDNGGELKNDIQTIIRNCRTPDFDILSEDDFVFIKEMIDKPKDMNGEEWPYFGRDESKSFMYEIISNKRNGIDVDKWDYLARDSYMLGVKVNFDYNRCFMTARALRSNEVYGQNRATGGNKSIGFDETHANRTACESGESDTNVNSEEPVAYSRKQICYRDKDAHDLYDLFYTRMTLHKKAYQHKTHRIIGMMICDALIAANDAIKFVGKDGKKYRISDAVDDMKAYTMLTDDIFHVILNAPANGNVVLSSDISENGAYNFDAFCGRRSWEISNGETIDENETQRNGNLKRAKKILYNILNRKLYKCVDQTQIRHGKFDEKKFKEIVKTSGIPVPEQYFDYDIVNLDYGMKDRDPMSKVRFYTKENDDTPIKLEKSQVSYVLPETFAEHTLRIFCKESIENSQHPNAIFNLKENIRKWLVNLEQEEDQQNQHNTRRKLVYTTETSLCQEMAQPESDPGRGVCKENHENKTQLEPNTTTAYGKDQTKEESLGFSGGVEFRPALDETSDSSFT